MSTPITIQIAQIMFPLIAIVSVGVLIGKRQHPRLDSINDINLNVFIPALVFSSLLHQDFLIKEYALLGLSGLALVLLTALIADTNCAYIAYRVQDNRTNYDVP